MAYSCNTAIIQLASKIGRLYEWHPSAARCSGRIDYWQPTWWNMDAQQPLSSSSRASHVLLPMWVTLIATSFPGCHHADQGCGQCTG